MFDSNIGLVQYCLRESFAMLVCINKLAGRLMTGTKIVRRPTLGIKALRDKVAKRTGLSNKQVQDTLEAMVDIVIETICQEGKDVRFDGLFTIKTDIYPGFELSFQPKYAGREVPITRRVVVDVPASLRKKIADSTPPDAVPTVTKLRRGATPKPKRLDGV